jgi:hypothetical protein
MDCWDTEKEIKCKIKMDPMKICFEDERWLDMAEDYAQWLTLVLSVLKYGRLQPEIQMVSH